MKSMRVVTHPGNKVMKWLNQRGFTITKGAQRLGVGRVTLSRLVNTHASLSVDMAIRLGRVSSRSPLLWLDDQHQYERFLLHRRWIHARHRPNL